ncbi:MAG TPA: hypothetical protein VFW14_00180 [Gaiellales bacterium]|nr:hypothetical protein [Gaiellales bacterium]
MSIVAAVLVATLVLAAGAPASAAVYPPGAVTLPTRVASVFGLGYAVAALTPTLLVVGHVFDPVVTAAALLIVTAALAVAAGRRCRPLRALADDARAQVRAAPGPLIVGAAVIVAIAAARLMVPVAPVHGAWRYWADGLELAAVGHVPAASLQWGVLHPPAVTKIVGNAFTGELSFVFAAHPLAGMATALWLAVSGYAVGLFALGWELGLRKTAPLLPLLGIAGAHLPLGISLNADGIAKLTFFQDEDMGRAVAVIGAAMALPCLRGEAGRAARVATGLVLAAAGLTHAIPAGVAVAFLLAYAFLELGRRETRRPALAAMGVILATAGVTAIVLLGPSHGEIGLQGASGGGYVLFLGRYDPTAYADNRFLLPKPKSHARWYEPPTTTISELVDAATGWTTQGAGLLAALVATAVAVAVVLVWGAPGLRLAVLAAVALEAVLLAVALAFSYRQSLYVPATFGERRLFEYASIPVMLVALAVLDTGLARLGGAGTRASAVVAAVLAVLVLLAAGPGQVRGDVATGAGTADYIAAARIATPCNARILPTVTSKGAFQALTGRADILEGMAPFLRPAILRSTVRLTHLARQYLAHPAAHPGFLDAEHVDYLLVGRGKAAGWAAFAHAPGLAFVRQVGAVRVYRHVGQGAGRGGVRPDGAPGYTCRRTPFP